MVVICQQRVSPLGRSLLAIKTRRPAVRKAAQIVAATTTADLGTAEQGTS